MINKKAVKLILERWIADLATKDRSLSNVPANFEELFGDLYHAGVSFEDAYAIVDTAIKAHYPSASVSRNTFKRLKNQNLVFKTEKEFIDDWRKQIEDMGKQVFYNYFQIDGESDQPKEKPTYGSMSTAEYLKQRRYADSYPTINPEDIPDFEPIDEDDIFDDIFADDEDKDCAVNLEEV